MLAHICMLERTSNHTCALSCAATLAHQFFWSLSLSKAAHMCVVLVLAWQPD